MLPARPAGLGLEPDPDPDEPPCEPLQPATVNGEATVACIPDWERSVLLAVPEAGEQNAANAAFAPPVRVTLRSDRGMSGRPGKDVVLCGTSTAPASVSANGGGNTITIFSAASVPVR